MIFERLTLHNFQRYHGSSSIVFPEPGSRKSIVLVPAPNNSGNGLLKGGEHVVSWRLPC